MTEQEIKEELRSLWQLDPGFTDILPMKDFLIFLAYEYNYALGQVAAYEKILGEIKIEQVKPEERKREVVKK